LAAGWLRVEEVSESDLTRVLRRELDRGRGRRPGAAVELKHRVEDDALHHASSMPERCESMLEITGANVF
jgi:hypothetical protein